MDEVDLWDRPDLTAVGKPGSGYTAEKLVLRRDTADPPIEPAWSLSPTVSVSKPTRR